MQNGNEEQVTWVNAGTHAEEAGCVMQDICETLHTDIPDDSPLRWKCEALIQAFTDLNAALCEFQESGLDPSEETDEVRARWDQVATHLLSHEKALSSFIDSVSTDSRLTQLVSLYSGKMSNMLLRIKVLSAGQLNTHITPSN